MSFGERIEAAMTYTACSLAALMFLVLVTLAIVNAPVPVVLVLLWFGVAFGITYVVEYVKGRRNGR